MLPSICLPLETARGGFPRQHSPQDFRGSVSSRIPFSTITGFELGDVCPKIDFFMCHGLDKLYVTNQTLSSTGIVFLLISGSSFFGGFGYLQMLLLLSNGFLVMVLTWLPGL